MRARCPDAPPPSLQACQEVINAKDTNDKVAAWFKANDNSKDRFLEDPASSRTRFLEDPASSKDPYGDVTILCGACSKETMCRSAPPPSLAPDEPSISTPTPDVVPSRGSSRRRAHHPRSTPLALRPLAARSTTRIYSSSTRGAGIRSSRKTMREDFPSFLPKQDSAFNGSTRNIPSSTARPAGWT